MTLLEVENLSIGYQTRRGFLQAVDDVSFTLDEGRALGFVGESGCGKTTIGMALMGLLPPNARVTGGRIRFEGRDILSMTEEDLRDIRGRRVAMIFQAAMNALNPVQRTADQLAEAILTHEPSLGRRKAMDRVAELYEMVGIATARMRNYPHQYSGGMKQRAVIAMALACNPRLIIADEPTTALDVIVQDQILSVLKRLRRDLDLSVVFISHDIAVVADMCQRIGVMYAGQLVEFGRREEVFYDPAHPYTQRLLASYPTLSGSKGALTPLVGEGPDLVDSVAGCRFLLRCGGAEASCQTGSPHWMDRSSTHRVFCCREAENPNPPGGDREGRSQGR